VNMLECQSNDRFHSGLFFSYAREIRVDAILFEDDRPSSLSLEGLIFEKKGEEQTNPSDSGIYELKKGDFILAKGGFLSNYNFPFSDIYMEVPEEFRGKGYASLMVQELKKEIYRQGRVPAARCNPGNPASRSSLIRAGFRICGALLTGKIDKKI
jgi:RimJ/RimL family protein N-acetyltransferase